MPTRTPSGSASADRAIQNIKPEIRALKGYAAPPQGRVIAKLNQNENPFDIPAKWKQEILNKMANLEWGRYPDNQPIALREKLAQRFSVGSNQILLGHGSNQLLYLLMTAVITPGEPVLVAPPTFSLVELAVRLNQGQLVQMMKKPDLSIDQDTFLNAAKDVKLIFLCSPDNPTGQTVELDFLEEVLSTTNGLVLWDEAYTEFCNKSAIPLLEKHPNLIVSRTFSKAFSLAGLRIGFIIAHPEVAAELAKANIPYNLDQFSVLVTDRLLDESEWMEQTVQTILQERDRLFAAMQKLSGVAPFPSEANFITFGIEDAKGALKKLQERGVLIRDMTYYPRLESALRVTVGTPEENDVFLKTLKEIL
ncbi:histidinol-phosphate transaminase [candidate division KSB1 bacterium]|nr:histidinol-phosphate transaminase [candidate division KSB1 bacterium]